MNNKIYIFSDLHGNLPALDAVINDIGLNEFHHSVKLFLGDYIDFGPYPDEVVDLIKALDNAHFVIGNHDQYNIDVENKRVIYNIESLEIELNNKNVPWKEEIIRGIREACLK